MIIGKNVWILRPMPHSINRMKQFLEGGFIAIGYPTGNSFKGKGYDEIRELLDQKGWSEGIGNVNLFVLMMNVGDFVIVPDDNKKDVYIGEVISDYYHEASVDRPNEGSYPHQRKVSWFFDKKPLLRSDLPEVLRSSLRYPGAVANITKHRSVIESVIRNESTPRQVDNSRPLLTKAITVLEELLDHGNAEIRLRAAEALVRHYSNRK